MTVHPVHSDAAHGLPPGSLRAALTQIGTQSDLARAWNLSRARVSQYAAGEGFPAPLGRIGGIPVYSLAECEQWRQARLQAHGTG